MDLQGFIEMNALECLNNCNDTSIRDLLESKFYYFIPTKIYFRAGNYSSL